MSAQLQAMIEAGYVAECDECDELRPGGCRCLPAESNAAEDTSERSAAEHREAPESNGASHD